MHSVLAFGFSKTSNITSDALRFLFPSFLDPCHEKEGMLHEAGKGGFLREGMRLEPRTAEFKLDKD